ncbi:carotenoid oxygenase family protein [Actinocorallia sp. A-T 12471]|uniref:carotenoid oxygenase family protein n=1 Tax=Actinocorallia sp. A-T 12471 TaxID=3089813 RepID=UPI0029D05025|nr:carotenoid oxygenase family protein [Actinocorallia sp. A-T 12471]MDX6740862.1 carotenoid oxygenase family protein [Actinocorallia sp. A-T 12471]
MGDSPYLRGPYAPVREEITAFDLPVTGRIPQELDGSYLRNGPNPLGLEDASYGHWFNGAGMLHGVRLRDGRAEWYRNRWVRSQQVAQQLGEKWPGGPVFDGLDFAANTHIIRHAGKLLATVESGPLPYAMTPELGTLGPCDFDGTLPGGFAAHTKLDKAGDLHAVAYYWAWPDHVQYLVVGPDGRVKTTVNVPVADGPMMHDFALTDSRVVLLDLPITFDMDRARTGDPIPYRWNASHEPRIGLLPRAGGGVMWFPVEPCFVFHTVNAYDADGPAGPVVLDVCRYDGVFDFASLEGSGPLTVTRLTLDPATGRATRTDLDDRGQEFPRMDERVTGLPHRYAYTAVIDDESHPTASGDLPDTAFRNAIIKRDFQTGATEVHDFGRHATAGEAVFVPAAPTSAEDDGYLLAYVHDPARSAADLVILPAQDLAAEPLARVHLPARIPLGFHGAWLPTP